ncbi:hypothetical protein L9F63_027800, partial [Diploptera punctata]
PIKWPLIGNVLDLKSDDVHPHESIGKLAHKYGEVVGFYLGRAPVVLISGVSAIREALNQPELQGRPTSAVNKLEKKKLGSDWKNTVPVRELVSASGANVIYHMLTGKRFELTDPKLKELMNIIRNLTSLINASGGLAGSMPILLRIMPSLTEYPEALKYRKQLYKHLTEIINEHKKNLDENNPMDFIDMFLIEMKKSDAHPSFHDEQLLYLCTDLFIAGSDTTSGSLSFAILHMILYPGIQTEIQKELDEVVGRERLPSLKDKTQLRYTEATLCELYRVSSVDPLAVPHAVLNSAEDVEFRGYVIPKDARVLINLYGLHMDMKYWRDPDNFRPDRFLDNQGNLLRDDALIPFGLGKRSCIGESMARNNIFLTFTALLQKYNFRIPDGERTPSAQPDGGLVLCAKPFRVKITPRF